MKRNSGKKNKIKKINRMRESTLKDKIETCIAKGDRSSFLKHMVERLGSVTINSAEYITNVCNFCNVSAQNKTLYLKWTYRF